MGKTKKDPVSLEILPLTPAYCEEYLHFFDVTPHWEKERDYRCYCVCWAAARQDGEDLGTGEARRAAAERYVRSGAIRGYLARQDGRVVGWCHANDRAACAVSRSGEQYLKPLVEAENDPARKVLSVLCFVVAPEFRRRGIAGALLDRVCEDAAKGGYDCVEGYPCKEFTSAADNYTGPLRLFLDRGFEIALDWGPRACVRKELKKDADGGVGR